MIKREAYIAQIRGFYDSDLIKIITGVRRCGKSVILGQIMDEIRDSGGEIIYLDFEDRIKTAALGNWNELVEYIDKKKSSDKCYVFLDEIQEVEGWPLACKTLRLHGCSLFITGSNSKLLSKEFTKELSGRYVSFRIRPFVYKELSEYANELGKNVSVIDYLIWGGFPKRIEFQTDKDRDRYLSDLNETIVANDIINRYKIRKTSEFRKFANYILISNGRNYSAKSIADYMNSHGVKCTSNTISKWVSYLTEAYIIDEISKYSTKAKRELEQSKKIYNCDVGLNSIRCTDNRFDLTHNLENVVYNELLYMGYSLRVYDNNGKEIDFLAEKDGLKYYVQVAYSVADEKTYNREFNAFNNIPQINKKILITNDEIDYSTSNIQHIKLSDFLRMNSLM